MSTKQTTSAIEMALQKYHTPVGDLFVAMRHGRMKRCFSRDTALRYLAFFMTTHAFCRSEFRERHPDILVNIDHGEQAWQRGKVTDEYHLAHQRTLRRLRKLFARKREMQKWSRKFDAWVAQRDELMKQKPF